MASKRQTPKGINIFFEIPFSTSIKLFLISRVKSRLYVPLLLLPLGLSRSFRLLQDTMGRALLHTLSGPPLIMAVVAHLLGSGTVMFHLIHFIFFTPQRSNQCQSDLIRIMKD